MASCCSHPNTDFLTRPGYTGRGTTLHTMTYYVIASDNGHSFDIVKVLPCDEANFLHDYGHRVQATGTNLAELLHRFAARKAAEWLQPLPLQPRLTRLHKRFPDHQLLRLQAYYHPTAGWIACGKNHPETNQPLTWIDQLKIALMAGASKCRLALAHKRTGSITYVESTPQGILE